MEEVGEKHRAREGGVSSKGEGKSGRGQQHPEADTGCCHRYCSTAFDPIRNRAQSQRLKGVEKTHTDCGSLNQSRL